MPLGLHDLRVSPKLLQELNSQCGRAAHVLGMSRVHADGRQFDHLGQHLLEAWPRFLNIGPQAFVTSDHSSLLRRCGWTPTSLGIQEDASAWSTMRQERPWRRSSQAMVKPVGPAPTMSASQSCEVRNESGMKTSPAAQAGCHDKGPHYSRTVLTEKVAAERILRNGRMLSVRRPAVTSELPVGCRKAFRRSWERGGKQGRDSLAPDSG